ncbi:MAG: class I tRNA ligase family protein [bacterium]|nr:class I tRNA ligase family protein [bacterium]
MKDYDHKKIEGKWQKEWEKKKIYYASPKTTKPKFYSLIEFPYPSGDGLHVGHPRPYIGMDVISRKKRMEGYNVLYPIGWDAFGLPTENYAIKTGKDPRVVTKKNSDNFRRQIKSIGISFDWSREVNTTDPKYYKWTQWIFLQFFKKGLAYKAKMAINWCPKDKIGLANEEVIDGKCERCGTEVEKRDKEQWMLGITKYAERLDKDLDTVDYLPQIKLAQRNWIGKSEGAVIKFVGEKESIEIFTTRPETIFGATFVVVAGKEDKFTGRYLTNPATKEKIPVWEAEYVMEGVGTGAIMAVPAHDERDYEFAKKHNLPIKNVVIEKITEVKNNQIIDYKDDLLKLYLQDERNIKIAEQQADVWLEKHGVMPWAGVLINSGKFDGTNSIQAKKEIIKFVGGKEKTIFKLRDWIFSRQRYWGEPIPIIHCESCGYVPVPEKDLPVELPKVKNYQPTDSGESPLANISKWVNVKCPKCKGLAKRETDTMPNWAGSSWYYLRYADPKNTKEFASMKNLKYWLGPSALRQAQGDAGGVDWYNGGYEHTTLHLLYSRFWHKFLFDLGLVPTSEPYKKRTSHGIILGEGGAKMSKSLGNVINPDDIVKHYGADTLRLYEMFMGPFDQKIAWSEKAIVGPRRFLERVWKLRGKVLLGNEVKLKHEMHRVIKKVSEDIEKMDFNTAVSALMIYSNVLEKHGEITQEEYEVLLKLLSPFAPHMTEELWMTLGNKRTITLSKWPKWDENMLKNEEVKIVVQVNGKVRAEIMIAAGDTEEEVKKRILSNQAVLKYVTSQNIKKTIYVKNRLFNIVI